MTPHVLPRLGLLSAAAVLLALLPVALTSSPTHAGTVCTSEQPVDNARCDDTDPPDTALVSADPTANRHHYLRVDHVSIAFAGAYDDSDTDPIAFQCSLAPVSSSWSPCTSPVSYTGLADTTGTPYTFSVRAVDSADEAIDATTPVTILGTGGAKTDLPDLDQTPASASFLVDTTTPITYVTGQPFDDVTPDHPMLHSRTLSLELDSNEADAGFTCRLDGRPRPCAQGSATFAHLAPGDHELTVAATDLAGNTDATPEVVPFSVPQNLTPGLGHGFVRRPGAGFGGDVLVSHRVGATLTVTAHGAKELRVLAPTGASLGRITVQQGRHQPVPLMQGSATGGPGSRVVYQRFFGRAFTGTLTFTVVAADAHRPAEIDAVLLH